MADGSGSQMFPQVNGAQIKETRSEEGKEVWCTGFGGICKKRRLKNAGKETGRG